jgi:enterochelin esterase-like enzyme
LIDEICRPRSFSNNQRGQQEDEIYSRHLQRPVKLSIINTPIPNDKSELNLLLLNDGQDLPALRIKEIVDSLYEQKRIQPLLIVAIHAGDRMQEYGIAGKPDYEQRGSRAGFYNSFIDNELLAFVKKKAGVRKFNSVAIAGWSLGGLSAFDIAWNNSDKIDKVGVFSGSFWWRDLRANDSSYSDEKNRIVIATIKASRRKPSTKYWFFVGSQEETSDRDNDGVIDVQDDTEDVRLMLIEKGLANKDEMPLIVDRLGKHDLATWSRQMPDFLIWAFGK